MTKIHEKKRFVVVNTMPWTAIHSPSVIQDHTVQTETQGKVQRRKQINHQGERTTDNGRMYKESQTDVRRKEKDNKGSLEKGQTKNHLRAVVKDVINVVTHTVRKLWQEVLTLHGDLSTPQIGINMESIKGGQGGEKKNDNENN